MIDDQEIAKSTHPFRKNHLASRNGLHLAPRSGLDEKSAPGAAALALRSETSGDGPAHRKPQIAFLANKAAIIGDGFVMVFGFD